MNSIMCYKKVTMVWATVLCAACTGVFKPSHAGVIAKYDFPGLLLASTDTEPNSTASDFSFATFPANTAGVTSTAGGTIFARSTVVYGGGPSESASGSEEGALNLGHYFAFSVTPASGYQIDLTSMSFDILLNTSPDNTPPPTATWFVKTFLGGFGSSDPTLGSRNSPVSATNTDLETITPLIDLSGLPIFTTSTELRLYLYDNQHSSGIVHRLDNVILNGDVSVIPEPTSVWMVAFGLLMAFSAKEFSRGRGQARKNMVSAFLVLFCFSSVVLEAQIPGGKIQAFNFTDAAQLENFVESPVFGVVRYPHSSKPGVGGRLGKIISLNRGEEGQTLHYSGGRCNIMAEAVTISILVKYGAGSDTDYLPARIVLALSGGGDENLVSSPGKLGMRLFKDSRPENSREPWRFQLINGISTRDIGESFALKDGHWYRMEGSFSASRDGKTVSFTLNFQDMGADGQTNHSLSRKAEGTTPALDYYNIRSMAVGILGQNAGGGAVAFDNFMIAPGK